MVNLEDELEELARRWDLLGAISPLRSVRDIYCGHAVALREIVNAHFAEAAPECDKHKEVQHRDGKPPWCNSCGWTRGHDAVAPQKIKDVEQGN